MKKNIVKNEFNENAPWGGMKRCIVNPNHSVEGYLHEDNSNNWQDGSPVDWNNVESSGQNVMVEIPKFYYSKKVVEDERIFGVADAPIQTDKINIDEWEVHPAFFRDRTALCDSQAATPVEVDFRYAPAFKGWVDGQNRLRSLPNKQPTGNKTIGAFRNHAKNMGVGWTQMDYYLHYAIQMLYITEYGNPDSQTMIGRGYVDGNSSATTTGATLINGNNTFGETTGKKQISYRGIEDFWGNIRSWVDGYRSGSNRNILIGNKGFNDNGTGYKDFGNDGVSSNLSGDIRDIHGNMNTGFSANKTEGSYDSDGLHDLGYLLSGRLPSSGGNWSDGSRAGAFYFFVDYTAPNAAANIGACLAL